MLSRVLIDGCSPQEAAAELGERPRTVVQALWRYHRKKRALQRQDPGIPPGPPAPAIGWEYARDLLEAIANRTGASPYVLVPEEGDRDRVSARVINVEDAAALLRAMDRYRAWARTRI